MIGVCRLIDSLYSHIGRCKRNPAASSYKREKRYPGAAVVAHIDEVRFSVAMNEEVDPIGNLTDAKQNGATKNKQQIKLNKKLTTP